MYLVYLYLIEKPKRKFVKKFFKSPYNSGSQPYYNHSACLKTSVRSPIAKYVDILNLRADRSQIFLRISPVVPIYSQTWEPLTNQPTFLYIPLLSSGTTHTAQLELSTFHSISTFASLLPFLSRASYFRHLHTSKSSLTA